MSNRLKKENLTLILKNELPSIDMNVENFKEFLEAFQCSLNSNGCGKVSKQFGRQFLSCQFLLPELEEFFFHSWRLIQELPRQQLIGSTERLHIYRHKAISRI